MYRSLLHTPTAMALALAAAAPGRAQDLQDRAVAPPAATSDVPQPATDEEVTFSANTLDYDDDAQIVTATGDVRMVRAGNRLRADKVTWNRATGDVRAEGDVAVANPGGDTAYGDNVQLKDTLKDGVIDNLLLVLENGGRLAARKGTRIDGVSTLDDAAYTPCRVADSQGCPQRPSWQIAAVRVVHNPESHRISYQDATLSLFGLPIMWLPRLSHPDGEEDSSNTGLLVPQLRFSRTNGLEIATPVYYQFAPNRDLVVTPHVYSEVLPALEAQYRELSGTGAYQVSGMITYGSRIPASVGTPVAAERDRNIRGYFDANGRFQLGSDWTLTGSTRLVTDKTFLRRYDISRDDRLRTVIAAERIVPNSYFSIAGYAVQTLRPNASQRQQPVALPAIDWRLRIDDPILGGRIETQVNSLAIIRNSGQDTQRAFAGVRWDLRRYTPLGQEVVLTAYGRADVYHTSGVLDTPTVSYRGDPGWSARAIGALAAEMRWPFAGELFGGTQIITPRVQFVAAPPTANLRIPNEDARAIELEDSNLFALNRFNGYDRWEDGSRVTYGGDWAYDRPRLSVRGVIGQSYRLNDRTDIFPVGTGLASRFSDIVGRTVVRYGSFLAVTHRYRLDKDNLAIRRNDVDFTIGSTRTYFTAGYLRLNRDIDTSIEDLRDREEVRLGARVQVTKFVSVFGSTVIDLTSSVEDPTTTADGYEPIRHRLGILYSDECLDLGVTWRRDYERIGDARRGNTFLLQLALKNLGR